MQKFFGIPLFALWLIVTPATGGDRPPQKAYDLIRPDDIRRNIDFLASDSLKGRNTPSPELKIAAHYIARQFEQSGLSPVNGSYFQEFKVSKIRLGKNNSLKISRNDQETSYKIKREFMPFDMTGSKAVEGSLVFAGYGITAPEYHYDDYEGLEVTGKIVLVLRHEPREKDPKSPFAGQKMTPYGQVRWKVQNAIDHGAAGVLVVTDPLNHRSLRARGFPWPSLYEAIPNEALPLTLSLTEKEKLPVVQVGKKVIRQIFGSIDSLRNLQQEIDQNLAPKSRVFANIRVHLETSTDRLEQTTQNVVGLLEGRDPKLKQEVIVIGAHYDHVGYIKDHKPGVDYIYNGADDNASGTCLVLSLAKAFGQSPLKPKRSILFITFAGEEKGLFGSRAYVEKPLFPLANTVAMLNFDMVGRNAPDSVSVGGHTRSPDLIRINEEENRYIGLKLDYSIDRYFNRSDQYNFARKKIPFLFYFTGEHADYHRVSDHAYKVNVNKIAMIAKLGFRVAWRLANTRQRFHYVEPKKK